MNNLSQIQETPNPAQPAVAVQSLDEFLTKQEFVRRFPHLFQMKELDWLIKCRSVNGLQKAIRKPSKRKLLIHVPSMLAWIETQNG